MVVRDFDSEDDFNFALQLFQAWGIGKAGADNGLLLFIATGQRRYRFITGYGLEGIFTDYYLSYIGEHYLLPHFREEDYDGGVLAASEIIEQVMLAPDAKEELARMLPGATPFFNIQNRHLQQSLWILAIAALLYWYLYSVEGFLTRGNKLRKKDLGIRTKWSSILYGCGCFSLLMFAAIFILAFTVGHVKLLFQVKSIPWLLGILCSLVLAMKLNASRKFIAAVYDRDVADAHKALRRWGALALLPALVAPLAWIDLGQMGRRFVRQRKWLTPPDNSGDWQRINRNDVPLQPKKFLDAGQLKEESMKSQHYELWRNTRTGMVQVIPWAISRKHQTCPACGYRTYLTDVTEVMRKATYVHEGMAKKYDECAFCKHRDRMRTEVLPILTRSNSSSGSGGGGSRSSGGGSFGGGRSGGGGAGGRW